MTRADPAANPRIDRFIEVAESRIFEGERRRRGSRAGFVSSDLTSVREALDVVVAENLAPGSVFCEWGSGYGAVTTLAAMLDFDACGIEIQEDLVAAAEELADEFAVEARFALGTFVPEGGDICTGDAEFSWWETSGPTGYEELDLEPEDCDIFYAYPWPGEEALFDALFARYAAVGALFVTYHGVSGLRMQRKLDGDRVQDLPWS